MPLAEISFYNVVAGAVSFGADYERMFNQVRTVTLTLNGLILLAIFLMVTKPGA
jgi:hypothetical protein